MDYYEKRIGPYIPAPCACTTVENCCTCLHCAAHPRPPMEKALCCTLQTPLCVKTLISTMHTAAITHVYTHGLPVRGHVHSEWGAHAPGLRLTQPRAPGPSRAQHLLARQQRAAPALPAPCLPLPPCAGPQPATGAIFSSGGRCWRGTRPTWHCWWGRLGPRQPHRGPQPAGENGGSVQPPAWWRWRQGSPGSSVGLWQSLVALPPLHTVEHREGFLGCK